MSALSYTGRRVAFQTLGCRLNQFETDSLAGEFESAGYQVVPFDQAADAYIINTCTVTNKADRKSRNAVNRAARRTPLTVVTGCFVESHRDTLEEQPGVIAVDNQRKRHIVEIVDAHLRGEILHAQELDPELFDYRVPDPIFHTRSMVKIQDGCDNFCTFCIIPFVRGHAVSRDPQSVLDHVRASIDHGYREIVVTGVNISRYHHGDVDFSRLMEQMLELDGDYRLRISSMEPDSLDDRFFELLNHPRMTPHLHLCLQSGSERILLKMRRQYTVAGYRAMVDRIRAQNPDFNLTTDIIVGFPGETESDFAETCRECEAIAFSHIHTFAYSRRSGTRADRMPEQIPERMKQERSRVIREIGERGKRAYRAGRIETVERLLVERVEPSGDRIVARGYGEHYVPILLDAAIGEVERNRFVSARITGIETGEDPSLLARVT